MAMLTPKIGIGFENPKNACFRRSTSFGHTVDVTADVNHMLYFDGVGNLAFVLNKVSCSFRKVGVQCVSLL